MYMDMDFLFYLQNCLCNWHKSTYSNAYEMNSVQYTDSFFVSVCLYVVSPK